LATTRRAARLLTQLYDRHLSEYGIEAAQFALLMTLDSLPEKEQSSLAQALGMDKTTLSRNLKVLAVRGWVASARGNDARRRELSLTPEGRTVLAKAKSGWKAAQASLNQSLSGVAWDTMLTTIDGVSRAASAASE
jgi:DNA-binding MarR family transcriptional regulator